MMDERRVGLKRGRGLSGALWRGPIGGDGRQTLTDCD